MLDTMRSSSAALLLVAGLTLVTAYGLARDRARYPYTYDSAKYIDAARHLARGDGFKVTPGTFAPSTVDAEVPWTWPPGYSLLIALGAAAGFDPVVTALWISRVATAAVFPALVLLLWPLLGRWGALVVAGLAMTASGLLEWGTVALTDTQLLLAVVASFALFVHGLEAEHLRPAWLAAAGMLAGIAYVLRNAAIAALVATAASAAVVAVLRLDTLPRVGRACAWWLTGVLLTAVPLCAWNMAVFGAINPYRMPASTRGYLYNARDLVGAALSEASGFRIVQPWQGGGLALLGLALLLMVVSLSGASAAWARLGAAHRWLLVLLACYAVIGSAMLLQARSTFEWGEPISQRHTLQYVWAGLALAAIGCRELIRRRSRVALVTVAGIVLALAVARVSAARTNLGHPPASDVAWPRFDGSVVGSDTAWGLYARDAALARTAEALAQKGLLFSNIAAPLKNRTGLPIRELEVPGEAGRLMDGLERVGRMARPGRPVGVLLVPLGPKRLRWATVIDRLHSRPIAPGGLCVASMTPQLAILESCFALSASALRHPEEP